MRAAVYDRFGDESVLRIVDDHPEPPVGPDVVLVRAHAAGVNPVDLAIRAGHLAGAYPHHFPIVPGWEMAGVATLPDVDVDRVHAGGVHADEHGVRAERRLGQVVAEGQDVGAAEAVVRDAPHRRPFTYRPNAFWISRRESRSARSCRLS